MPQILDELLPIIPSLGEILHILLNEMLKNEHTVNVQVKLAVMEASA